MILVNEKPVCEMKVYEKMIREEIEKYIWLYHWYFFLNSSYFNNSYSLTEGLTLFNASLRSSISNSISSNPYYIVLFVAKIVA